MNKDLYMPFFYDWVPAFEDLEADDFKKLVLKMIKFHKNPKELPKPRGSTKILEAIIFPQLKRLIKCRENGKKGGNPNIKKSKEKEQNSLKPPSTLGSTTNTKSNTNTNTNTDNKPNTNQTANTENEERFGIFWEKYPRKLNRTNSFLEFIKLNLSSCEFEYMLSQLENHKKSKQWKDNQYIPTPENYLRLRKWTDVLEIDDTSFDTDEFFQMALERSRKERHDIAKEWNSKNNS